MEALTRFRDAISTHRMEEVEVEVDEAAAEGAAAEVRHDGGAHRPAGGSWGWSSSQDGQSWTAGAARSSLAASAKRVAWRVKADGLL